MENDLNKPKPVGVGVELTEEVAEGVYSNLAIISHSSSECVIDFARVMPNVPKAKVKSRIVLTPEHVKHLLLALQDNLAKYEQRYGPISKSESETFNPTMPINFGNSGEA